MHPRRFISLIASGIGLAVAGLVFLHYWLPGPPLQALAQPVLRWMVLLAGVALLLAAANLLRRHAGLWRRSPVHALLLLAFAVTFVAGLSPVGFDAGLGRWLYRWLLAPGLAALFALFPVFLAFALYRRLHLQDLGALLFALALLLVLMGQTPLLAESFPFLPAWRHNLLIGPGAAALRGLLLGVALGVIVAVLTRLRLPAES